MGNTIDWGQAAVNNTIGFGDGAENNTIGWGDIQADSWSPETNLTGTGGTPAWSNTLSTTFDGVDDYVDCGTITALNGGVSVFSTSLWFKYSGTLSTSDNIILSGGSTSSDDFYIQPTSATNIRYGHSSSFTDTTVSTMSINTWYNLILVHNGTGFSIYLNGILQGSSTGKPSPANNQGTNFNIGRYNISSAFNFLGNIDEVAVWNSDQSANASAIGSTVPTDLTSYSPISWWRMGDGSTYPTINDEVGSNNGTMTNMIAANFVADVPT